MTLSLNRGPDTVAPPTSGQLLPKLCFDISEVVVMTGISKSKLYLEIKQGALRIRKVGGRTVILAGDLQAWLEGASAPRTNYVTEFGIN